MGRKPEKKLGKQEPKAWLPAHREGGALGLGSVPALALSFAQ